jgi:fucose permease
MLENNSEMQTEKPSNGQLENGINEKPELLKMLENNSETQIEKPPNEKLKEGINKKFESIEALENNSETQTGKPSNGQLENGVNEKTKSLKISHALKIRGVGWVLAIFAVYCGAEYIVGLWGSSFLVEYRGFTPENGAIASSLFYVGITSGRLVSGFLSAKFSGDSLIKIGLTAFFPSVVLLLIPLPPLVYYMALFAVGFSFAPIFPCMIHETPGRFGSENSQKIIGLQMASAYCGSAVLPPLVGLVANGTTLYVIPISLLVLGIIMLLFSVRLNFLLKK